MRYDAMEPADLSIQYYAMDHVTIEPWWDYRDVASPFTRLFYVFAGHAAVRHERASVELTPGHLVLVPPFLPVTYQCESRCENVFVIFTCQMKQTTEFFSLPLSCYGIPASPEAALYANRLVALNPGMKLAEVNPNSPQYNAHLWQAQQGRPDSAAQLESQGLLRILLAPFLAHVDPSHSSLRPHRLHAVLRYIDQNLHAPLSLKKLAGVCNLHPTYLSDLFVGIIGSRPIPYINRKRVEKAQLILVTTNQPVKHIAYELGFSDPNYFSRLFRKLIGCSPAAYRANHR